MSYARQGSTIKRLQKETFKSIDILSKKHQRSLIQNWKYARRDLRSVIVDSYRASVSRGTWSTPAFNRVKPAMGARIRAILQQFHAKTVPSVKNGVKAVYDASVMRHAWALDQVTPENYRIHIPARKLLREAEIINDPSAFESRWAQWIEAYNSALVNNLSLNAINSGSSDDAADLVDSTRANFPAYRLIDALKRIFDTEVISAISDGEEMVGDINGDAIEEEIWRTRGDLRVCDDCDENEGHAVDDVGFPPEHPNCHCFTEVVPVSFAELLRSGD